MKKSVRVTILIILLFPLFSGCGEKADPEAKADYEKALSKYNQGEYPEAKTLLKKFLRQYPAHSLTKEAETRLKRTKTIIKERELKKIRHIFTFSEEGMFFQSLAFSHMSNQLVLASDDHEFRFYQTQLSLNPGNLLDYSTDESKESDSSPENILGPGYRFSIPFPPMELTALDFSPDGRFLAAGFRNGTVGIWKAPDYAKVKLEQVHKESVCSIAFSPNGHWMITSSKDGLLNIWDTTKDFPEIYHRQDIGSRLDTVVFCPPNRNGIDYLAVSTENYILVSSLKLHQGGIKFLTHIVLPNGEGERIKQLIFNPRGKRLASLHTDNLVRIWNVDPQTIESTLKKQGLLQKTLTWPTSKADWNIWSSYWKTGWKFLEHQIRYPRSSIYSMVLGHLGKLLITSHEDKSIIFWDIKKGKRLKTIRRTGSPINYLLLSPDKRTLVTASLYKKIFLWDVNIKWDAIF